ncbi:MAG: hypothetical protein QNJ12_02585 [Ilumatobacter sp.]|uniref:hypothetical protein n=1 Tax=Ilumatobacter sp. TaxID=1967498 RepID=UPI0026365995|nr:hypothetical protein [Ilumatobacter sp.]MDJ0767645.1 hypothetical protein [Ilumatobacter sp.]
MKKLLISALALTVGAVLAPAGLAAAQSDESTGDPTVEGRGSLAAKGTGDVEIDMGGWIRLRADGDVILTDRAGDMRFVVRGVDDRDGAPAEAEADTEVILSDFTGGVYVRGSDFSVIVDGDVELFAHGRGQAWLEGSGLYKTRYGDVTAWDGMVELGGSDVAEAEPIAA